MVYIKETIGPYTQKEAQLNPLDVLLKAGYPKEKIKLVLMMRDPVETWSSWARNWERSIPREALFQNFITSHQTVDQIRQQALEEHISTTTFVYESLRSHHPQEVVAQLFSKLGLVTTEYAVDGWDRLPAMGTSGSRINMGKDPPLYADENFTEEARKSTALNYHEYGSDKFQRFTTPIERLRIIEGGLFDIYNGLREQAEQDLGNIHIETLPHGELSLPQKESKPT